jgi:hypothetical protein
MLEHARGLAIEVAEVQRAADIAQAQIEAACALEVAARRVLGLSWFEDLPEGWQEQGDWLARAAALDAERAAA